MTKDSPSWPGGLGALIMEGALRIRDKEGWKVAAEWLEQQGISYELAECALIGSKLWTKGE